MANCYEDAHICDHQHTNFINQFSDENIFLDDDCNSSRPLLDDDNDFPTFCVTCKSISDPSNLLGTGSKSSISKSYQLECNGHGPTLNNPIQPLATGHYNFIGSSDGCNIPLLSNGDGFSNVVINSLHINGEDPEHCHAGLPTAHNSGAWKQLLAATIMCLTFMVAEVIGGYLAGSLAVMTDAAHLLSDFVGFLVSLFAIYVGRKPATRKLSFGYYRAEVLGALLSITIIWTMTAVCVYLAVLRVVHQDFEIQADTMMVVAGIGVVINIIMALVLHGACHGVSHTHSHAHTRAGGGNINVRAAVIHIVGDLIQSFGVLVSAVVIKFHPELKVLDPVCTLAFSLLVLATTRPVLSDATHVLMEGFPRELDHKAMSASLGALEGVRGVHGLHVWALTVGKNALAVHLAVDKSADADSVLREARKVVRQNHGIWDVTIQVEHYHHDTAVECGLCQPL